MNLTAYHAKYFVHELTKRSSLDNENNLLTALSDARAESGQLEASCHTYGKPLIAYGKLVVGFLVRETDPIQFYEQCNTENRN